MKQEDIKIILKNKSDLFFLARIIKSGNAFNVLGIEDNKELKHLYRGNKELLNKVKKGFIEPSYLGGWYYFWLSRR